MLRPFATLLITALLVACQSAVPDTTPSIGGATRDVAPTFVEGVPDSEPPVAKETRRDGGPSVVEAAPPDGGPSVVEAAPPDGGPSVVEAAPPDGGPSVVEAVPLEITPSVLKARMLIDHGLHDDARRELIEVVFSAADASEKASALDLLATVAVLKSNFKAALDTWNRLIDEYPTSAEAIKAKEQLPLLTSVVGQLAEELVDDAAAQIYLRSADFWSEDRDRKFTIDTSWIPNVEAAVYWYDIVINEFPGSSAARIAYEDKMRTILGWKDPGQYGQSHGILENASYLPQLITTFRAYEAEFPTATRAQGFRFLIAQAYWNQKSWSETRNWLNEIIAEDGDGISSFYRDLAERRLKKVEY